MTTNIETKTTTGRTAAPRLAVAGAALGGLAAFAGATVLFPDPLTGARTADEVAQRLADTAVRPAALLLLVYALLATVVVGALHRRVGGDGVATRIMAPLGVGHLLLTAGAFAGLAGAATVGNEIFDGVSPAAAETGLVLMNAVFPMAQFAGTAFLLAVLVACRAAGRLRWVGITAGVFGVGLLLPPVGWAVLYLLPLWFAVVGVTLAAGGRARR